MDKLKIFSRHLTGSSKLLLVIFFLMAAGLLAFFVSPFLLIWSTWSLAWRVGLTGLLVTVSLFISWWLLYNTFYATIKTIIEEVDE